MTPARRRPNCCRAPRGTGCRAGRGSAGCGATWRTGIVPPRSWPSCTRSERSSRRARPGPRRLGANGWFAHRTERDELRASTGGTRTAVRHGRGRLQMHRSERKDARHASPRRHPVLHQYIFSACAAGRSGQKSKPRRRRARRVRTARSRPPRRSCRLASARPAAGGGEPGVPGSRRCAGSSVATPAARARSARAPADPATARTVRARPVAGRAGRTVDGRADQPAPELDDRLVQPSDDARLQPHVVVAEEREGRGRRGQHRCAVLGEPAAGQVPRRADPPAVPGEHPQQGGGRRGLEGRRPVGLIAHQHVERMILSGQPGQVVASSVGRFRVGTSTSMTPSRERRSPALETGIRMASTLAATEAAGLGLRVRCRPPWLDLPVRGRAPGPPTAKPARPVRPRGSEPVADRVRAAHVGQPRAV